MRKIAYSVAALSLLANIAFAGGDVAPVAPVVEAQKPVADNFFKTVDGYLRIGYQHDSGSITDAAIGGKLHVETKSWNGLSVGASFYTTHVIGGQNDGGSFPFFDGDNKSYSILGEAYLLGQWGNTTIKIGRQELDTPFADGDDNGMIPNTFEVAVLVNKDLPDTTIVLAHVHKWSGVDADEPSKFTKMNGNKGVQALGVIYEGIEGLALSGWYYRLKDFDVDSIAYIDANYEAETNGFSYGVGLQFARQHYSAAGQKAASVYGVNASIGYGGFTLSAAYNKSSGNAAINGFGGGPFYTSANIMTIAEAGAGGKAYLVSAEYDASNLGISGLTLSAGYLTLKDSAGAKTKELDLGASYAFNDNLSLDIIYSKITDHINGDNAKNIRAFVNYTF